MCDCDDQDVVFANLIDDPVGKTSGKTASGILRNLWPRRWAEDDTIYRCIYFTRKTQAQAFARHFVKRDGIYDSFRASG